MITQTYAVVAVASTAGADAWPQPAYRDMLDLGTGADADRWSVADFWSQETAGDVRIAFEHRAPVTLPLADADWTPLRQGANTGERAAMTALVARLVPFDVLQRVDGVLLVSHEVVADSAVCFSACRFSATVRDERVVRDLPCAYVDVGAPQSIWAHEVGHMLGIEHPFGITSGAGGVPREYGSPPCVMGSAGRLEEMLVDRTPVPAGSQVPAALWRGGPGCARASLVLWASAPDGWRRTGSSLQMPWLERRAWSAQPDECRVGDRASRAPRAVVYGPPLEGSVVLEVRRPRASATPDWDAGLELELIAPLGGDADTDAFDGPGLVVHRFVTIPGVVGMRAEYVGTIPLPLGAVTDLVVPGHERRRVRVVRWDAEAGVATVRMSSPEPSTTPWASISAVVTEVRRVPRERVRFELDVMLYPVAMTGPTCSGARFAGRRVDEAVTAVATAYTSGLDVAGYDDRLETRWSVGGVDAPLARQLGDADVPWSAAIDVDVRVPDGYQSWTTERRRIVVVARATWQHLVVQVPGGDGEYDVPVSVSATQVGGTGAVAVGRAAVRVTTQRLRFGEAVGRARRACTTYIEEGLREHSEFVKGVVLKPGDLDDPRPLPFELASEVARRLREAGVVAGGGGVRRVDAVRGVRTRASVGGDGAGEGGGERPTRE